MAGAKPGVHVVQLKQISVPRSLQDGAKFVKWDEESAVGTPVTLRVDSKGFFLSWTDQNKETECLDISTVRDARTGRYAKIPKDAKLAGTVNMGPQDIPLEEKTVTIAYGSELINLTFVNFCCNSKETSKEWADELMKMAYNLMSINSSATTFLEKAFTKLQLAQKDGKIPVKNILKMFSQNREVQKRVEKSLETSGYPVSKSDTINAAKFTFEEFLSFYRNLTSRQEVELIFEKLVADSGKSKKSNSNYLTTEQFIKFLNESQRDPRLNEILYPFATASTAKEYISLYEPNKSLAQKGYLSVDGFLYYLMSDDNAIVSPDKLDLNADMNQPLSHYFINSSHNTYLTGHQLTGRSSVEMYRQCLLAGCRCVELDCWNGRTSEEEPVITHGYTVVTDISFKEVVEAIADSAFKTSQFPVILSFENHCSPRQQAKMAAYCKSAFGDMLLSEPLASHPLTPGTPLPSPNQLLRKIIIKNKKKHFHKGGHSGGGGAVKKTSTAGPPIAATPSPQSATLNSTAENNKEVVTAKPSDFGGSPPPLQKTPSKEDSGGITTGGSAVLLVVGEPTTNGDEVLLAPNGDLKDSDSSSLSEEDDEDDTEVIGDNTEQGTASQESEAGAELSALVNYVQPVHFHGFDGAEKKNRSYEISSFVETAATTLLKECPVEFVNYNKRQLSRLYPKGTRVDSSNYMPQVFWNAGCQLVALNFQTLDLPLQLNFGIFEYNGRGGYLLKPDFMRRHDRRFDPFAESMVDGIIAGSMHVQVLSGQFLSDKKVGTYVEVESYGLPADTFRKKFRTKVVPNNGINPVYDETPFVFKKVVLPDLAVLRIAVYEEGGKMIGHRILPVVGLRPGYRHISLRNESGQPLTLPTLFVHIAVNDYVPDDLSRFADALVNPIEHLSKLEERSRALDKLMDDEEDEDGEGGGGDGGEEDHLLDRAQASPAMRQPSNMGGGCGGGGSSGGIGGSSGGGASGTSSTGGNMSTTPVKTTPQKVCSFERTGSVKDGLNGSPHQVPSPKASTATDSSGRSLRMSTSQPGSTQSDPVPDTRVFDLSDVVIIAESLEKIKDSKQVQAVVAKLEKEIQSLKKKHDKAVTKEQDLKQQKEEKITQPLHEKRSTLGKTPSRLFKKLSKTNMREPTPPKQRHSDDVTDSSAEQVNKLQELHRTHSQMIISMFKDHYKTELELREKYHDPIYNATEKAMQASQAAQLKELQTMHDNVKTELLKNLESVRVDEIKNLKKGRDKNEFGRIKREIYQKHIQQAVAELQKLSDICEEKRKVIEQQHEEVRKQFEEEKSKALEKLQQDYKNLCEKVPETCAALLPNPVMDTPLQAKDVTSL